MLNKIPLLPELKIDVQFEWICPHCKKACRSQGYMKLEKCNMVCPHCRKEIYIDARLGMNNRKQ